MKSFTQKLLTIALLFSIGQVAMADRGIGKKSKSKTVLNITTPSLLRNSIAFNLKSGLSYKGSLITNESSFNNSIMGSSLITYQKENTTYIIPYKHKIAIPEMRQGYTGVKIIIRAH